MAYPEKPADTAVLILEPIKRRWSPVLVSDKPMDPEQIATLFEAARWAPSSYNEQPWRYVYATKDDGEKRQKLESLLVEGNAWAKNAYLLAISFARSAFTRNDKPNRHAMHDLGAATGFITLQATDLGLVTHQMAGFEHEKANQLLGVPPEYTPGSMIAIGHPGDPSKAAADLAKRDQNPRSRKAIDEFAFRGKWRS